AISAALGILAILTGDFGEFQIRIILTTLTISAASICALASGALWESKRTKFLPTAGVTLAIAAALLLVIGIWTEPSGDQFWKFTASLGVLAAATAHACGVSLARLAPQFAWARAAAFGAIFFLAFSIIYMIYADPQGEIAFRIIGGTSIVVAALTIMMPIFHRLSRGDLELSSGKATDSDQRLFPTVLCPRCGTPLPNSAGNITCTSCGCRFVLTILNDANAARQI
ncbi:MAG: hypothetical protein ABJB97_11970, partial [Acidobacteriota bacterium]